MLALVGGGIWAATSFFGAGPQPAEALPDTTLGYASIDLDPSGGQKIEAIRTLRKFPAFKDQVGLDTTDDLREKLFDEIQKDAPCKGLDYGDDIEPWLGDRAAVAAVDTGEDQPSPVFVVQVNDADKAEDGLSAIKACAADKSSDLYEKSAAQGGWVIEGDWAIIAESEDVARSVADAAAKAPLGDDEDYQKWADEVGDPGIVNLYAAPEAGAFLADNLGALNPLGNGSATSSCSVDLEGNQTCDDTETSTSLTVPAQVNDALKDFKGMAATIRFADGALELEVAGDPGVTQGSLGTSDRADDVLATLPDDTAVAMGVGFEQGWLTDLVEQMASYSGGETTADELLAQLSDSSGLDLPADAETLTGTSVALSISSDFDPEAVFNGEGVSELPLAAKVQGDPDAIAGVLEKLRGQIPTEDQGVIDSDVSDDAIAIGPNADYRAQVLEDGALGANDVFKDVVPEAEKSSVIFFVNFDAGDGWLANLAGDDQDVADNLAPLSGFGISAWREGDAAHSLVRITTD